MILTVPSSACIDEAELLVSFELHGIVFLSPISGESSRFRLVALLTFGNAAAYITVKILGAWPASRASSTD